MAGRTPLRRVVALLAVALVAAGGCMRADTGVVVSADGSAAVEVTVVAHPAIVAAAATVDPDPVAAARQIGIAVPDGATISPVDDGDWSGWTATFDVGSPGELLDTFADADGTITAEGGDWVFDVTLSPRLLDEIGGGDGAWGRVQAEVRVTFDEVTDPGTGDRSDDTVSWDLTRPGFDGRIVAAGTGTGLGTGGADLSGDTGVAVVAVLAVIVGAIVVAVGASTLRRRSPR